VSLATVGNILNQKTTMSQFTIYLVYRTSEMNIFVPW